MALNYYKNELKKNALLLASKGKGILAVDESTKTVGKRLAGIGVENTEENRKAYRGMLFTTEGLGKFISGAILFEETLYQNHQDGESMVKKLNDLGIIPGIKVDKGLNPLPGAGDVETFCSGLDGLVERAAKYYQEVQDLQSGEQFYKLQQMDLLILPSEKMHGVLLDMLDQFKKQV